MCLCDACSWEVVALLSISGVLASAAPVWAVLRWVVRPYLRRVCRLCMFDSLLGSVCVCAPSRTTATFRGGGLLHGAAADAGGDDLSTIMRGNELSRRWSWGSVAERPLLLVDTRTTSCGSDNYFLKKLGEVWACDNSREIPYRVGSCDPSACFNMFLRQQARRKLPTHATPYLLHLLFTPLLPTY